jgi:hypothetical protein
MKYTYEITVDVPDGIDAGEPSLEIADAVEAVERARSGWRFSAAEVVAVDGDRL